VTLRVMPDSIALVLGVLRSHPSITALVGSRVHTSLPATTAWPLITVGGVVAGVEKIPGHLDEVYIDVQAWSDNDSQANLVARTARAVLTASAGSHSRGVVTHVRAVTPERSLPDPVNNRPRWVVTMGLTIHPHPLTPAPSP
jgi:hypothetical protein